MRVGGSFHLLFILFCSIVSQLRRLPSLVSVFSPFVVEGFFLLLLFALSEGMPSVTLLVVPVTVTVTVSLILTAYPIG